MPRLWAAGAAIVMCVALGGAQGAAQVHAEAVSVTATPECDWSSHPASCTMTASDSRATGPLTMDVRFDVTNPYDTGLGISSADVTLPGLDGTWTGRAGVTPDASRTGRVLAILTGDGDYEGWTYVFSADDPSGRGDFDSIGTIFQGPPPQPWVVPSPAPAVSPSPSR